MEEVQVSDCFELIDESRDDVRVEWVIARAEFAADGMNRAAAELYGSIAETLAEARAHPEVWVPVAEHVIPTDSAEFAVRAAVMDVAVRLGRAESTVRAYAQVATTLQERFASAVGEVRRWAGVGAECPRGRRDGCDAPGGPAR